jgi:hypothetical protein
LRHTVPVTLDVLHSTGSAEFPAHRPRGVRGPVSPFSEVRTKMKPRNPISQGHPYVPLCAGGLGSGGWWRVSETHVAAPAMTRWAAPFSVGLIFLWPCHTIVRRVTLDCGVLLAPKESLNFMSGLCKSSEMSQCGYESTSTRAPLSAAAASAARGIGRTDGVGISISLRAFTRSPLVSALALRHLLRFRPARAIDARTP